MIGRPTDGYTECPRVNGLRPSACTRQRQRVRRENRGEVSYLIFKLKLQQTEYLGIYTK